MLKERSKEGLLRRITVTFGQVRLTCIDGGAALDSLAVHQLQDLLQCFQHFLQAIVNYLHCSPLQSKGRYQGIVISWGRHPSALRYRLIFMLICS